MDDDDFQPKIGRMRSGASPRARKYLHRVIAAAALAGPYRPRPRTRFSGSRIGRGAAVACLLRSRGRLAGLRGRRAVVKARLVRLAGKGLAGARAHLAYVQRDGAAREGEKGRLYSAGSDDADGRAFLERSAGDRHQFRFIVSAEDGAEYEDLRPLIRRVMSRMDQDLGTRLDWVAADHRDTAHPHSHVMLRGRDDRGANLVIARDYIARGLRERVAELVSLDLGPRTDLEIRQKLRLDVGAERLTSIDRSLLREMDGRRSVSAGGRGMFEESLRAGRLRKLEDLGLARPLGGGRWQLAEDLEATLRAIGERCDRVRTMQRALAARGLARAAAQQAFHSGGLPAGRAVVGRLIERGLADEGRDRHFLIVDGIDGRVHYVDAGAGDAIEPLPAGAIVRIEPRGGAVRAVDRTVAQIASLNRGRYSEELHRGHDQGASPEFMRAHVRRLEAIRRSVGGPERLADGTWAITEDHLDRAAAFEAPRARSAPVRVALLSVLPLEALVSAEGCTWLDRELVASAPEPLRSAGFGVEVGAALAVRRAWLVGQGLAWDGKDGAEYPPDLLTALRGRELAAAGARLSVEFGRPARACGDGENVAGTLRRRLDLASGRFGLVETSAELLLVPWRPELELQIGRDIVGRAGPGGLSWSIGRGRGPEIG